MNTFDQSAAVFQNAHVDAIARCEHLPLLPGRETFEVGDARAVLGIDHHPCSVFTNGDDARRERLTHAPNDALTVEWARTLRIDATATDAMRTRILDALARNGVRVRFGPTTPFDRTYALVEGPEGVDPAELPQMLPEAHWFNEAIIALAIEPAPEDALPHMLEALGGAGAPAGVCDTRRAGSQLLVEFRPSVTSALFILELVDVELQRFHGYRRTQLLSPLPVSVVTQIAAQGLQAPEIAPDRVLEELLGAAGVE